MPTSGRLPPGQQLAAPGKWPIVGERLPIQSEKPWEIEVSGRIHHPWAIPVGDLLGLTSGTTSFRVDIHCVTRWSKLGVEFTGVPVWNLVKPCHPLDDARFLSFVARSKRGHSTSLSINDVLALNPLVVVACNGHPLTVEHGGPVRVVVPGRYFYKSLKWLARIEVLAEDRLGHWEATAGYHNHADPWQQERYLAPTISRQQAAAVIAARDFSGQDLRSIDARARDLAGLMARGALLRDADFRHALLANADFTSANLSNARLQQADLRGASFRHADVEGADFSGADLAGADFRGASLLGTTFVDSAAGLAASLDRETRFDLEQLEELTPSQADFVRRELGC